jgi:hypothetical protein
MSELAGAPATGPVPVGAVPAGWGTVGVLADDLIWASRLVESVRRAGAYPLQLSGVADLTRALAGTRAPSAGSAPSARSAPSAGSAPIDGAGPLRGVIVDLLGRRYDGVAAVERVHLAGVPVIAVAEHDDLPTRKRALAAGASRVYSYNKFSTDGTRLVATWLSADRGEP